MSDQDFSIPIPQSTTQHALLGGILPQIPTIMGGALVLLSILATRSMKFALMAIILYLVMLQVLYLIYKHDPWLIDKLLDAIGYRSYYPARSGVNHERKGSVPW